jgi:hypothetical protein
MGGIISSKQKSDKDFKDFDAIKENADINAHDKLDSDQGKWPVATQYLSSHSSECGKFLNLRLWTFDIWRLERPELHFATSLMLGHLQLDEKFHLSFKIWSQFTAKIEQIMNRNNNPYHGFYHLIDVTQACFVFIDDFECSIFFDDVNMFSIIVGSLIHDLDHPGTTNAYQVNRQSSLAIVYNDNSVLENHHCAIAFQIFKDPNTNIFCGIDSTVSKRVRKEVIEIVLCTDIAVHFSMLPELETCIQKNELNVSIAKSLEVAKVLQSKDKLMLMKSVLHASDISNPLRLWNSCKKWSDLVMQEFFAQGDREKAEGLPVSMNMDRDTTFQDEMSLNFIDFIVAPLYYIMIQFIPKSKFLLETLLSNRMEWDRQYLSRMKEKQAKGELSQATKDMMAKFEVRKVAFDAKVKVLISDAEKKLESFVAEEQKSAETNDNTKDK